MMYDVPKYSKIDSKVCKSAQCRLLKRVLYHTTEMPSCALRTMTLTTRRYLPAYEGTGALLIAQPAGSGRAPGEAAARPGVRECECIEAKS
jgi:hypothetical protein